MCNQSYFKLESTIEELLDREANPTFYEYFTAVGTNLDCRTLIVEKNKVIDVNLSRLNHCINLQI